MLQSAGQAAQAGPKAPSCRGSLPCRAPSPGFGGAALSGLPCEAAPAGARQGRVLVQAGATAHPGHLPQLLKGVLCWKSALGEGIPLASIQVCTWVLPSPGAAPQEAAGGSQAGRDPSSGEQALLSPHSLTGALGLCQESCPCTSTLLGAQGTWGHHHRSLQGTRLVGKSQPEYLSRVSETGL